MDLQKFYMGVVFDAYEYFGAHIGEGGVSGFIFLQLISNSIACSCSHFSVCFGIRPVGGLNVFCCGLRRRPSGV